MSKIKKTIVALILWFILQLLGGIPSGIAQLKGGNFALMLAIGLLASQVIEILLFWLLKYFKPSEMVKPVPEWPVFLMSLPLGFAVLYAVNLLAMPFDIPDLTAKYMKDICNYTTGFLAVAIVGPISEEILMRRIVLNEMREATGKVWGGILISAALFAIIHFNPIQIVFAFPAGILLGWLYCKTESLLVPICVHILNNSFAFLTIRLGMEEPTKFMSFEVLATLAACITVAIVLIIWMNAYYKKKEYDKEEEYDKKEEYNKEEKTVTD